MAQFEWQRMVLPAGARPLRCQRPQRPGHAAPTTASWPAAR